MRYLDKIIFINSANIRYSEIKLDGNVHFIGTQGVGKSTILRAILYFYNADKQRLGIPREKKSFDEFYLPHSNSYIVYEVRTEHGSFCVMTFRHMARAAFRFIDAPYSQRWFVDENGAVTSESPVIRSRLGGRAMSRIVDHYDEYRNIIYGNRLSAPKEFARYAMLESQRYENIPRSITNVFLNSKVDADFIKDIIIRSMEDDEPGIDLGYYRRQVSEFEQEFNDIGLWFKKDRQGRVPVRMKAEDIVDRYHRLLYLDNQISEDAAEIQYAVKDARERIPLLQETLAGLTEKEERQRRLLGELADKFESEKTSLNRNIAVLEEKLRTTSRKRKHYAEIGMDSILERAGKEPVINAELAEKKRHYDVLTSASDDIKVKYEKLRINLQLGQQKYYRICQQEIDGLRALKNERFELVLKEKSEKREIVEARFNDKIEALSEKVTTLRQESDKLRFKLSSLSSSHPCADDIDKASASLHEMECELSAVTGEIKALAAKEGSMRSALEIQQHINDLKISLADARKKLCEFIDATGLDNELEDIIDEPMIRLQITALEDALSQSRADLKTVREIHEKKGVLEVRAGVLPNKIKALKLSIEDLREKEKSVIAERKAQLESEYGKCIQDLEQMTSRLDALQSDKKKQLQAVDKAAKVSLDTVRKDCDGKINELEEQLKQKTHELNLQLGDLEVARKAEIKGRGVDMDALALCEQQIHSLEEQLRWIEGERQTVFNYHRDYEEYFDLESQTKDEKTALELKLSGIVEKYEARRASDDAKLQQFVARLNELKGEISSLEEGIRRSEDFLSTNAASIPQVEQKMTFRTCQDILEELRNSIMERQEAMSGFKQAVTVFMGSFSGNTFHFRQEMNMDGDYLDFASTLSEFLLNDKIEDYRRRTSDRYVEILGRVSREMGDVTRHVSEVGKIIREINYDFKEKNFVGAIKSIELRSVESSDAMVQLLMNIKKFSDEHQFSMGEANLFNADSSDDANARAVDYLRDLMSLLVREPARNALTLSDTFQLQFRIVENDNDTLWVEKIANVGSDGTDILVKAMVNIMLINVFKEKVSRKFGEFRIHCMMDEVGKLHPSNVKGILDFANSRNILLINSSPTTYNVAEYRHTYLLSKDEGSHTIVRPLITRKEEAVGL